MVSPEQRAALRAYVSDSTARLERRRRVLRAWLQRLEKTETPGDSATVVRVAIRALNAIELELDRRARGMRAVIDPGPAVPKEVEPLLRTETGMRELFGTPTERGQRQAPQTVPSWAPELQTDREPSGPARRDPFAGRIRSVATL